MAEQQSVHSESEGETESSVFATGKQKEPSGGKEKRTSTRTPRASKKDLDSLAGKVDKLFSLFEKFSDKAASGRPRPETVTDPDSAASGRHRPNPHATLSLDEYRHVTDPLGLEDDVLSIQPGQKEVVDLLGSDDGDERSHISVEDDTLTDRFTKYSTPTARMLSEMFGEDAVLRSSKDKVGICLDNAQKEVLQESWRSEDPGRITAFKETYKSSFPVSETDEEFLRVPSLDNIVDHLLIKRYGSKAATKSQSLYSQPLKAIEKLAYQGQMAARMGIIINMYTQQALGNLLTLLEDKEPNIDQSIQCVRDTFAMTTKLLDQTARSGAFHHLIRRRAAMADTNLHDFKDIKSHLWSLPLSHTGVLGDGLEKKLKDRQELNKQIGDLLPEVDRKRKSYNMDDRQWKRPRFNEDKPYSAQTQSYPQYQKRKSQQPWRPGYGGQKSQRSGTTKSATVSSFRSRTNSK